MRGHFLGGSRKLNRHWQSGGKSLYGYYDFEDGTCRVLTNIGDTNGNHIEFAPAYTCTENPAQATGTRITVPGVSGIIMSDYGKFHFYPKPSLDIGVLRQLDPSTTFPYYWYTRCWQEISGGVQSGYWDRTEFSAGPRLLLSQMIKDFLVYDAQLYTITSSHYLTKDERNTIINAIKSNIRIPKPYIPIWWGNPMTMIPPVLAFMGYTAVDSPSMIGYETSQYVNLQRRYAFCYSSGDFSGNKNVKEAGGGVLYTADYGNYPYASELNHAYMVYPGIATDGTENALKLQVPYRTFTLYEDNFTTSYPYLYTIWMLRAIDIEHCSLDG